MKSSEDEYVVTGDSQTEVTLYRIRLRFEKLFADPAIFDEPLKVVRRYLAFAGIPPGSLDYLQQTVKEIVAVDNSGNPAVVSGTAKYMHKGKLVLSEYMAEANLDISYVDFGSGLSRDEHEKLWSKGRWGEMRFEVMALDHESIAIDLPDVAELYEMLRERATPTTLASVELTSVPQALFDAAVSYLEDRLKQLATKEGVNVEVYASKGLDPEEKRALEKRLARQSTPTTVHVMLSRTALPTL